MIARLGSNLQGGESELTATATRLELAVEPQRSVCSKRGYMRFCELFDTVFKAVLLNMDLRKLSYFAIHK